MHVVERARDNHLPCQVRPRPTRSCTKCKMAENTQEQATGSAPSSSTGSSSRGRGRPKLEINQDRLKYLCSLHFTWGEIASLTGFSLKTIQRRAKEYGITKYSDVTDSTLDSVIRTVVHANPAAGEVMIMCHLHSIEVRWHPLNCLLMHLLLCTVSDVKVMRPSVRMPRLSSPCTTI